MIIHSHYHPNSILQAMTITNQYSSINIINKQTNKHHNKLQKQIYHHHHQQQQQEFIGAIEWKE